MKVTDEIIWKHILSGTSPEECLELEQQAAEDPDVALRLADARMTDQLLRDFLPTPGVNDDALAAFIAAEIEAEEKSAGSVARPRSPLLVLLPWAVAACLLIFGLGHWIFRPPALSWTAPTIAMATYRGEGNDLTPNKELVRKTAAYLQKMISKAYRSAEGSSSPSWSLHAEIKVLFDGGIEVAVVAVPASDPSRSVVWPSSHRSLDALNEVLPQLAADIALRLKAEADTPAP